MTKGESIPYHIFHPSQLLGVHHIPRLYGGVHKRWKPEKGSAAQWGEEHSDGGPEVDPVSPVKGPEPWSVRPSQGPLCLADGEWSFGLSDAGKRMNENDFTTKFQAEFI